MSCRLTYTSLYKQSAGLRGWRAAGVVIKQHPAEPVVQDKDVLTGHFSAGMMKKQPPVCVYGCRGERGREGEKGGVKGKKRLDISDATICQVVFDLIKKTFFT